MCLAQVLQCSYSLICQLLNVRVKNRRVLTVGSRQHSIEYDRRQNVNVSLQRWLSISRCRAVPGTAVAGNFVESTGNARAVGEKRCREGDHRVRGTRAAHITVRSSKEIGFDGIQSDGSNGGSCRSLIAGSRSWARGS